MLLLFYTLERRKVEEQVAVLKFAVTDIQVLSFKMNFNLLAQQSQCVVALLHIYVQVVVDIEGSKSYS